MTGCLFSFRQSKTKQNIRNLRFSKKKNVYFLRLARSLSLMLWFLLGCLVGFFLLLFYAHKMNINNRNFFLQRNRHKSETLIYVCCVRVRYGIHFTAVNGAWHWNDFFVFYNPFLFFFHTTVTCFFIQFHFFSSLNVHVDHHWYYI